MPNEARVYCSIWRDPDFLALPPGPQRMYLFLFTQPDISMCGTLPVRERYWASKAEGLGEPGVRADLAVLADRRFVVIDEGTQELLVRSKVRRDEVLKGPKLIKPLIRACQLVESGELRGLIAAELRRCQAEGLVNDKIAVEVEALAATLERAAQFTTTALFTQVDTLSDPLSHRGSDRAREKGVGSRGKGEGGPGGELALVDRPAAPAGRQPGADTAEFDQFWAVYPRREGKGAARKAWARACTKADPQKIIAAAAAYRDLPGREQQYTAHPTTWLNQERWDDELTPRNGGRDRESGVTTALRSIARNGGLPPPRALGEGTD